MFAHAGAPGIVAENGGEDVTRLRDGPLPQRFQSGAVFDVMPPVRPRTRRTEPRKHFFLNAIAQRTPAAMQRVLRPAGIEARAGVAVGDRENLRRTNRL